MGRARATGLVHTKPNDAPLSRGAGSGCPARTAGCCATSVARSAQSTTVTQPTTAPSGYAVGSTGAGCPAAAARRTKSPVTAGTRCSSGASVAAAACTQSGPRCAVLHPRHSTVLTPATSSDAHGCRRLMHSLNRRLMSGAVQGRGDLKMRTDSQATTFALFSVLSFFFFLLDEDKGMSEGVGQVLRTSGTSSTSSTSCSDVPPHDQATVARMRSVFASLWEFVMHNFFACTAHTRNRRKNTLTTAFDDRPDKTDTESTQQHLATLRELFAFLNTRRTHIWCRYRSLPAELLTLFNQDNLSKPSIIRRAASFIFSCLNECPRWFADTLVGFCAVFP